MFERTTSKIPIALTKVCWSFLKRYENACEEIDILLDKAQKVLNENYSETDGNYAFVCEKCAPTFGYYGRFLYENELKERARVIYERS